MIPVVSWRNLRCLPPLLPKKSLHQRPSQKTKDTSAGCNENAIRLALDQAVRETLSGAGAGEEVDACGKVTQLDPLGTFL